MKIVPIRPLGVWGSLNWLFEASFVLIFIGSIMCMYANIHKSDKKEFLMLSVLSWLVQNMN